MGAKKDECLIPDSMWKYASVARTKTETIVSMGEKTVCVDSGRRTARILPGMRGEWGEDECLRRPNKWRE